MALLTSIAGMRRRLFAALLLLVPPVLPAGEPGRTAVADELQVKAAFLLNFAAFVEWPATAFGSPAAPIVVGIYGRDPFGSALDAIFSGETMRGHSFQVKRIPPGGDISGVHILFVSDSERNRYAAVIARARHQPTLTVANGPGFTTAGGIIEFTPDRGRIRFRINPVAAREAGIAIGSKLLRLALN